MTGAAGFIGAALSRRLVAEGWRVRGVEALRPFYDPAVKRENVRELLPLANFEFVEADLATVPLGQVLAGVDVVFHLAGQPGVRASWAAFAAYMTDNILVTQRLLEACATLPLARFVFASTSSVYGDALVPAREVDLPAPASPYGVTKVAGEQLCGLYARAHGLPTVALRYFSVYGPAQRPDMAIHRMIEAALRRRPFILYGDGSQMRQLTYVDDVVDGTLRAACEHTEPGTVVNVAGGAEATLLALVGAVERATARVVELDRRPAARGDLRRTAGSAERAAELLGWAPRANLDDGLAEQVAWHRSRGL